MIMYVSGVRLFEGVQVKNVEVKDGKVTAVETSGGRVECEIFVNCAGQVRSNNNY